MNLESEVEPPPRRRSHARAIAIAVLLALMTGLIVGRFFWPAGDDIEVVEGKLGVVSADLDAVGLEEGGDSYDLTHATGVECLEGLERGTDIALGVATVQTGDEDVPQDAYLNSPEARVVLWVECLD